MAQRLFRKIQASQLTPSRPGPREEDRLVPNPSSDVMLGSLPLPLLLAVVEVATVVLEVGSADKEAEEVGELAREVTGEEVAAVIRGW